MRHSQLVRALASLEGFPTPSAPMEQVTTPAEAAAELLEDALARDDLEGRSILDLGSGTGVLSIGAALLGASEVVGVEADETAIAVARRNAAASGATVEFVHAFVGTYTRPADTVVMNPPFGAQRKHADQPFWDAAYRLARRRIYAFALAPSRSFIARSAVARRATVEATAPVRWDLPSTFPHHRKRSVEIPVDRWVLTPPPYDDAPQR